MSDPKSASGHDSSRERDAAICQYRFENESGFLPATWLFDPAGVAPGVHYVTGNLVGYEGHFGIATLAIEVRTGAASGGEAR